MGTTSDGYPYPEGTDLVMDGDDAIQALAEALTKRTYILLDNNSRAASAAPNEYPAGISVMAITSGFGDWPDATGLVVTQRFFSDRVQQTFAVSSSVPRSFYRSSAAGDFGDWSSAGAPFGEAAGAVTYGTIAAGASVGKAVTFPSGTFTAAPDSITATPHTSLPHARNAGTSSITATAFVLYGGNMGSQSMSGLVVDWHAVQMRGASSALLRARDGRQDSSMVTGTVTCTTPGCENEDIAIAGVPVSWTDETGSDVHVTEFECGVCGTDITDTLTPLDDEEQS